ncbi:MAG: TRAM domain-containing protein [Winkia neuii]|uniref:Class I SAM-dependent RNA methyltransferase n=1 Tax=Winkia neuii TaxID=33007 RepID=A0A2I1IL37_9ACTO|nr:TRAM domain-containing protein [Winkia neuii]OFJ70146.1 hypothetical protein HMPREF2851_10405 [Actinomyces sp. HMSC064C12]OFK04448.1 hypothetical protein HMPREF2835_04285 [Actinomyces sp. HMSC072A03]OFT56302.1 hypothetical protein HMPREF3152_01970 [Actinomyces sp. HMSC06A08]KWZ72135.1 TRAM domain protein [Winkia neuii]MDK8099901.1 TRAM domain-containing protein [Winkia neuii]
MGEIVELNIESPAHGGECIGRLGGKVVLVSGAIPGETVKAEIYKSKKTLAWAKTIEVLHPAGERIAHIWPLAEKEGIGGVELGHVSLRGGLDWKRAVILDQTRRIGGGETAEALAGLGLEVKSGAETGLHQRIRVEFEVNEQGLASMYRAGSHELVPIDSMPLACEQINSLGLFGTNTWQFTPGDRVRVVASGSGETKVVVAGKAFDSDRQPASKTVHYPLTGYIFPNSPQQITLAAKATDFWQTHKNAPNILFGEVMAALGDDIGNTVELFAGSGLFSVGLATRASRLETFEGGTSATNSAKKNLTALGLNARVHQGRIGPKTLEGKRLDTVVLDPPRSGAGRKLVESIAATGANKVLHIACDIAALARDASYYLAQGYKWRRIRAFDLFPYTSHVEQVALFER